MKKLSVIVLLFHALFAAVYSQTIRIPQGQEKHVYDDKSYVTVEVLADMPEHVLFRRYTQTNELVAEQVCACKTAEVSAQQYYLIGSNKLLVKDGYGKVYANSKLQKLSYYDMGVQQGDQTEYFDSGNVKRLSHFFNGRQTDTLKTFYESGQLQFSMPFINNWPEGAECYYYRNGRLKMIRNLVNNKYEGLLQTWYPGGQLKRREEYKDDNLISSKCYAVDGKDTVHYDRFDSLRILNYNQAVLPLLQYIHDSCSNKPKLTINAFVEKNGEVENVKISPNVGVQKTSAIQVLVDKIKWKPLIIDNEPVVSEVAFTFIAPFDPTNTKPEIRTPFWFYATQDYWLVRNYFEYGLQHKDSEQPLSPRIPFNSKKDVTFTIPTASGNDLYKQILSKNRGKVTLLNFWDPADTNSMYNIGYLQDLRYNYGRSELSVVNLCSSKITADEWKASVIRLQLPGDHYLVNNEQYGYISKDADPNALHRFMVLNRNGAEIKLLEEFKSPAYTRKIRQMVVGEENIFTNDRYGKNEYFTIEPYPELPFHVLLKEFYDNGSLRNEQVFISRIKGITAEVFNINRNSNYIIADGYRKQYYKDGPMKEQGAFVQGVQNGDFIHYYPSGTLWKTYTLTPKYNGMYTGYFSNGQVQWKSPMKDGKVSGTENIYYRNGNAHLAFNYKEGVLNGKAETFFADGKPKRLEFYQDGKLRKSNCFAHNGGDTSYYALFDSIDMVDRQATLRKLIVYLNKLITVPAQIGLTLLINANKQVTFQNLTVNEKLNQNSLKDSLRIWVRENVEFNPFRIDGQPCTASLSMKIELPLNADTFSLQKDLEYQYYYNFQDYWYVKNTWNLRKADWDKPFTSASFYQPQGTGPEVYKQILQKNKGKVIYIDFWATWCAPCKLQMPYSARLHQQFNASELAMVYVIVFKSPIEDWQKTVKELKIAGDHYFLTPEQATYFTRRFTIPSIPRYLLVDKDGSVVNPNAERPNDPMLVEKIKGLIGH